LKLRIFFRRGRRRVEVSQSVSVPNRERPPNRPAAALAATRCGTHALDVFGEQFAVGPTRAAVCVALARVAVVAMEDRIRAAVASGSVLASERKAGCCWIWRLMPRGDCAPLERLASCQDQLVVARGSASPVGDRPALPTARGRERAPDHELNAGFTNHQAPGWAARPEPTLLLPVGDSWSGSACSVARAATEQKPRDRHRSRGGD
jgi:hypothetical protein